MLKNKNNSALSHDGFLIMIDMINAANTINDLISNVPKVMGAKVTSYHHFAAVGAFDFDNLSKYYAYNIPKPISDFFDTNNTHKADPGIEATFFKGQFIWLSDLAFAPHVIETSHDKLISKAIELTGDGLCIPLYGPNNRKGYMFIGFRRDKAEFDVIMPYQVQALAQRIHVRYCLMLKDLQRQIRLTPREAEVLELISFGKTNSEIAKALKISPNTVAGYVKQVFLKLGTSDRVSAAMRAQSIEITV